jgi:hypothetical protein
MLLDVKNYAPILKSILTKRLIIAILFTIILIVVLINLFSYINILSKSSENPDVPKGRVTSVLCASIILAIILILATGYFYYKYFNPKSIEMKAFFDISPTTKFGIPTTATSSKCSDADAMLLADKIKTTYIAPNIDLHPSACKGKGKCGSAFPDPMKIDPKCKGGKYGYDVKGISKSVPK